MNRQRWGTFSVRDHLVRNAYVADVLLYDRLVIPYPPNTEERNRWFERGWQPDLQEKKLQILGDLGYATPWDDQKKDYYFQKRRNAFNRDVAFDLANVQAAIRDKMDPYYMTRIVLAQEGLPPIPDSVSKVWAMAAYPAMNYYADDRHLRTEEDRREVLNMLISNRFLVPDDSAIDPDDLLKEAIQLASKDETRKKREALYKWQDTIIEEQIPPDEAIREMEDLLEQYNKVLRNAKTKMVYKYSFLAIEVGLGLAGTTLGAPIATAAALAAIVKFTLLDRKPEINAGDCDAAAMIHDFQKEFKA